MPTFSVQGNSDPPEAKTTKPISPPYGAAQAEAVNAQLQRILSHPLFQHSKRYSELFKHIVDMTLQGEHDRLKERILGIELSGRSPDYDTSLDSIVRVAVTEVRKRLATYYAEPGHDTELRIELPARSYVAQFTFPVQPCPEKKPSLWVQGFRKFYKWTPAGAALLALAVWGGTWLFAPAPAVDRFWAPFFHSPSRVPILIGVPTLSVGKKPDLPPSTGSTTPVRDNADQVQVPTSDLTAANAVTVFLARHGSESSIRFSNATTLSDLSRSPVVTLGSFQNQWVMQFANEVRFRCRIDSDLHISWIEDSQNPASRNWMFNFGLPDEQSHYEYALITRYLNQTTGQWWIGIAGLNARGTLAAQEMAFDPKAMADLKTQLPRNWDRKNLQIVVGFRVMNGSASAARILTTYSW